LYLVQHGAGFAVDSPHLTAVLDVGLDYDDGRNRLDLVHGLQQLYVDWFLISPEIFCIGRL
jgi:hypothetical protein